MVARSIFRRNVAGTEGIYSGGFADGRMGYPPGEPGSGARFRGTWTPNYDGTVPQRFEQFDAAKSEWSDGSSRPKAL